MYVDQKINIPIPSPIPIPITMLCISHRNLTMLCISHYNLTMMRISLNLTSEHFACTYNLTLMHNAHFLLKT